MDRKKYIVTIGVEHPGTGHWLDAGTRIELTERQAKILLLNGHIKPADAETTAAATRKKRQ
ncbi:hypothetical protein GTGU_01218 [Trabulsiella guamensis ATCC 49490]|uniref:Uncharacterized protein n=1 Tax=Trabulsiella guamensis ATCC 49490 TaxID=1005994 RepID=A0A085AFN1_9ENTR|nr:hypothetical protein [Trabulsiella guamensis]KFC09026.1 hypothetical protein GTGU_01218 [Trabulsiella guamensis ATCC 49490]